MKKVLLLMLMLVCGMNAKAILPIDFGVRGGWTTSSADLKKGDFKYSFDNASGYLLGAYVEFDIARKIYLEPSLNFSVLKSPSLPPEMDMPKLKQVQIPLVVGYYVVKSKLFKLRGFLGPEVDIATDGVEIKTASRNMKLKNTTWHGKIGAGVDLWRFNFNIDYKFGLAKPASGMTIPRGFNLTLGFDIF